MKKKTVSKDVPLPSAGSILIDRRTYTESVFCMEVCYGRDNRGRGHQGTA